MNKPDQIKKVAPILLIILLGLIAYSNTFHGEFVFDDRSSIVDNPVIRSLDNFLLSKAGYDYNPRRIIGYLTFALNYRFGGLDVTGYHIFNLAVHVINAVLVYVIVLLTFMTPRMKGSSLAPTARWIALFAGLLFVAHPIQTQAVTYIVQRLTSLMAMFCLASVAFYAKWRLSREGGERGKRRSIGLYLLSLACMVLAMKTKENAFTLPAVVLLYDWFYFGLTIRKTPFFLVPILLCFLIVPLGLLDVQKPLGAILGDVGRVTVHKTTVSRWEYLVTQFSVVATYIRLLFLPTGQNLDYDYPISHSLFSPRALASFLFLIALWGLAMFLFRRSRKGSDPSLALVAFGILWFFVTLAVESSVIPLTDVIYEHRVYLPSAGAFSALAAGFALVCRRYLQGPGSRIPLVLGLATVMGLASATYHRNTIWADGVTLWRDVVEKSPGKVRGYNNLGAAFSDSGRRDEAIAALTKAISVNPDHAEAYYNLGRVYLTSGSRNDDAIFMFRRAIELNPDYADAHVNLAASYIRARRFQEAVRLLESAIPSFPGRPDAHFNLGVAYFCVGNVEGAARELAILRELDAALWAQFERYISAQSQPVR